MQIINKKCPYCSAIFKVKSALESHLQTKHTDKQMVNIDAIPEINFATKEAPFSGIQMPSLPDMTNIGQQMNVDFWKAKMMQQPQTSQFFGSGTHKRISEFSESEISFTDSNNDELPDEDYDMDNFNDDSNHVDEFQAAVAQPGENNKSKRHRTHVNRVQKSILRKIFEDVKSPSMIDCENIGREIGLFKRVVQVKNLVFYLNRLKLTKCL
jgi:AT-binding transcription factor 1